MPFTKVGKNRLEGHVRSATPDVVSLMFLVDSSEGALRPARYRRPEFRRGTLREVRHVEVIYTVSVRIPTENSGSAKLGIFKEGFFTKGRFLEVGVRGNTESSGISWVSQTPKEQGESCYKNEETESCLQKAVLGGVFFG